MPHSLLKSIARIVLVAFVCQTLAPTAQLFALTGGPTQPDFAGFEPVSTTEMVNPLTGQFTYNLPVLNIPGPNGSGYALSLSYHGGASQEEEASWVGYGWTLNPGAITRMKRGFPDEYRGEKVKYWNKVPDNWTATIGGTANAEAFSQQPIYSGVALRYNSYKGFGYTAGLNAHYKGYASFGLNIDNGDASFSYSVSPAPLLEKWYKGSVVKKEVDKIASSLHEYGAYALKLIGQRGYAYAQYSVANDIRPMYNAPYAGLSARVEIEGLFDPPPSPLPLGANLQAEGSFTYQRNVPERNVDSYGYMYSAEANDDDMMDYYTEKGASYERRDHFLGVPFSSADIFSISGEGIGGGFRLHNKQPGHFHPNHVSSYVGSIGGGYQQHLKGATLGTCSFANFGFGYEAGIGLQILSVGSWEPENTSYDFASEGEGDEPYFFRMNNDLGGSVSMSESNDAFAAAVTGGGLWGRQSYDPTLSGANLHQMNGGKRSGRSSHIAYTTFGDLRRFKVSQQWPNSFSILDKHMAFYPLGRIDLLSEYGVIPRVPDDAIAEFQLTNPSGTQYTYGMPVISYDERHLQYGLSDHSYTTAYDQRHAYSSITPETAAFVVGEESPTPYVGQHLLTAITTPDYIDRTHNGYSQDDFGGYTRFEYFSNYWGASDYFYEWRIPYNGLNYSLGSRSDDEDEMGSFSSGRRAIHYLSQIETKSHVAVFVLNGMNGGYRTMESLVDERGAFQEVNVSTTNSSPWVGAPNDIRSDAYPATSNLREAAGNPNATTAADENETQLPNQSRYLDRIELWSKDKDGNVKEKIQTVHFDYDYSLCRNLPNSFDGAGKLTLKKVWFEYNGIVNAKISPYVFGYEYKKQSSGDYDGLPSDLSSKYSAITTFADNLTDDSEVDPGAESAQNPHYNPLQIGRWGHYDYDPAFFNQELDTRQKRDIPWVHQNPDMEDFDPAAWQLKWIRLPSGGEIHVQYEQADYAFVQDRVAMVMSNLAGVDIDGGAYKLYLDIEGSLGITDAADRTKMVESLKNLFITKNERLYFKVLHSLSGDAAALDDEESDFVTGWAKVKSVGSELYAGQERVYVEIYDDGHTTPSDVAQDFKKTSRQGKGAISIGNSREIDPTAIVMSLLTYTGSILFSDVFDGWGDDDEIEPSESWLRIPVGMPHHIVTAKKGGGIRVKRLLMYDPGIETGAGNLFGSEFLYETESGSSSGVASNEPGVGREENALVNLLDKRKDRGWLTKVFAGDDREQFEGPIGESLLPAPSVSYSRVVVKSIHDGKTNPGFTIREFYTTKDFPSQCIYGPQDVDGTRVTEIDRKHDFFHIPSPFFTYTSGNIWAAQGYSFILNNLNGQPRKVSTYGGDYSDAPSDWVESSSQEYSYFEPGEEVPMLYEYSTDPQDWVLEDPGKEMEVIFEGRSSEDVTVDGSISFDGSLSMFYCAGMLFPLFSFVGTFGYKGEYSESKLRTHVSCKVVRYPAIVKKVISRSDGIESITENVAFNPLTGQPAVAQTTDGFYGLELENAQGVGGIHDRVYRAFTWPAALVYREMGQKAENEGAEVVSGSDMSIHKRYGNEQKHYLYFQYSSPDKVCNASDFLGAGDLIRLYTPTNGKYDPDRSWGVYHVESVVGNRVLLLPHSHSSPSYNVTSVSVKVLRSGRTNQLNVSRATITTYGPENP